jgi:hypothetical protein
MTELNSKCLLSIFIFLIFTIQTGCSPQDKHPSSFVDTLNYKKEDYDLMRDYFNSDTLFLSNVSKGVDIGDTNAIKVRNLLATEYESRDTLRMTESDIDLVIFSYYSMARVKERFKEIESRLQKEVGNSDEVQQKTDSLHTKLEELKKKMEDVVN